MSGSLVSGDQVTAGLRGESVHLLSRKIRFYLRHTRCAGKSKFTALVNYLLLPRLTCGLAKTYNPTRFAGYRR
jgi:hypothetical protein